MKIGEWQIKCNENITTLQRCANRWFYCFQLQLTSREYGNERSKIRFFFCWFWNSPSFFLDSSLTGKYVYTIRNDLFGVQCVLHCLMIASRLSIVLSSNMRQKWIMSLNIENVRNSKKCFDDTEIRLFVQISFAFSVNSLENVNFSRARAKNIIGTGNIWTCVKYVELGKMFGWLIWFH